MISIIIPSLNPSFENICSTLGNILKNNGQYEIVLVLQKSDQSFAESILKYFDLDEKLRIINDEGVGISRARNIAIKSSIGRWILLIDDDVYIKDDMIQTLERNLSDNSKLYYGNVFITNTNRHYVPHYIVKNDLNIWSYNRVCSVSLVINRQVFDQIGWFDENLGSGCEIGSSEESDLIIRALLNNIPIKYLSSYCVYHDEALHTLNKIKYYAMGSGALYRKYLLSGSAKLYAKFFLDLILRILLLLTFRRKRYIFFKGFLSGFFKYGTYK